MGTSIQASWILFLCRLISREPETTEPQEPPVMTLDEWKASQTKTAPEFKVRKPNEGVDTKQWKGTVALQKKKKGDTLSDEEDDDEDEYIYEEPVCHLP